MRFLQYFEHRSSRVIALFRAALALIFLVAMALEPVNGSTSPTEAVALIAMYFVFTLLLVPIAWTSWWFDQKLAFWVLAIDITVFVISVFVSEALNLEFTSPFMAFFALIMLSATLRWDWRFAATTGGLSTVLFILAGVLMLYLQLPLVTAPFLRRAAYMTMLFLVLVTFSVQRREPLLPPFQPADEGDENDQLPIDASLNYAMEQTGAQFGAIAWCDEDEPWTDLRLKRGSAAPDRRRLGPDEIDISAPGQPAEPCLFDLRRNRRLDRGTDNWAHCEGLEAPIALAQAAGLTDGLFIPLKAASGTGQIVLAGVGGLSGEHVSLGRILAREIAAAIDRRSRAVLEREALLVRTRNALARDLHDSVAQSLAGACFRLEALRGSVVRGTESDGQIVEIRDALRGEQRHVREMIEKLRSPERVSGERDLGRDLETVLDDASRQWGVTVRLNDRGPVRVPGWLSYEVQQLVREGIANAVRHGKASLVRIGIEHGSHGVQLEIADNGEGFGKDAVNTQPWSISGRVAALGGQFALDSAAPGALLSITLPLGLPA